MAKPETVVADDVVAAPADELSLDEFCTRLSETEKRPEAIAGFHYTEKAAGRLKGSQADYTSRFGEFLNKPV